MDIKIITDEKEKLELELRDCDEGLLALIVDRLNSVEDVEMAASKREHPLVSHPKLFLKVKKGKNAKKLLIDVMEEIAKEVKQFSESFSAL